MTPTNLTDLQRIRLQSLVREELEAIKIEVAAGFPKDEVEVKELLDLSAVLGSSLTWDAVRLISVDELMPE